MPCAVTFPDHVFYDASGKELEPTVENLGGKFFPGDSIEHMVEDDSPQGDSSGSNTVLYVAIIIAVVILAIAAAIILKKRKVRMVNPGIPGREARVPLNVFTLPEPGARHCRDCPRSRS